MEGKFIGCTYLDFPEKDKEGHETGNRIQGIKCCIDCPDPDWFGRSVTMPFLRINTELYNKIKGHELDYVGQIVELDYVPSSKGKAKLADLRIRKEK